MTKATIIPWAYFLAFVFAVCCRHLLLYNKPSLNSVDENNTHFIVAADSVGLTGAQPNSLPVGLPQGLPGANSGGCHMELWRWLSMCLALWLAQLVWVQRRHLNLCVTSRNLRPLPLHMFFSHGLSILVTELLTWSLRAPEVAKDKSQFDIYKHFLGESQSQGCPRFSVGGD